MPKVHYEQPDGRRITVDVPVGTSVMRGAIDANVRGIEADCGGCLSCATCHVYVDEADIARLAPPDEEEAALLLAVTAPRTTTSRLSCQITVSDALDGLTVRIPPHQS